MLTKKNIECPACAVKWDVNSNLINNIEVQVCSSCGLWFYDPNKLTDVDYDEVYKTVEYQEEYSGSFDKAKDVEKLVRFPTFKQFFTLNKPTPQANALLDVGCGVGRFCRAAHSQGWAVKGIDVSKTAIEKGSKNATFPMLNCTVEQIIDNNETYDVVTAFEVLEHLTFPNALLADIRKTLKPNGNFFCTVPNLESLTVKNSSRKDWTPPIHVLFFTQKSLHILLERAGFKDVVTGITWVNVPSSNSKLKLFKHHLRTKIDRNYLPDPLGLWAMGRR